MPVRPLVMGVVNVTPDSFSDGGRFVDPERAISHGLELVRQGASVIDVGGESSRPGAEPVAADVEAARVVPVVAALAPHVRVSIDTAKAVVAHAAIDAGATLLNDITASLASVAAERSVGWVAMHMQGEPRTMQAQPHYDDVVAEVAAFLAARAEAAMVAGVARERIWLDPGIGFGKTAAHNLTLLAHLDRIVDLGFPVLVGASRKGFIRTIDPAAKTPADRLAGSLAIALVAAQAGAAAVRVHDVRETVQALAVQAAIGDARAHD